MRQSYSFTNAQKLLIKPFERLGFITNFVLATMLSKALAGWIIQQPEFDQLWEISLLQYGIVVSIIIGVLVATSQWLVLRQYIPTWKWILAVAFSLTLMVTIEIVIKDMMQEFYTSRRFPSHAIFLTLANAGSWLVDGYLQWYVLRPYITRSRWWVFLTFVSMSFVRLLIFILYGGMFLTGGWLKFNPYVIGDLMLPLTHALAFCVLKSKHISDHPMLQSPLALAPDIVKYRNIQKLKETLYRHISQLWKTDLETANQPLTYLVGINRNGSIIVYEPMNQTAAEQVEQTPLPKLASGSNHLAAKAQDLPSLAKFQVLFRPPATVQIRSWRGISLFWLGVIAYLGTLGMSILWAALKLDTWFFPE